MNRFEKKKQLKQKRMVWIVAIILIVAIYILGNITKPVSETKAIELSQQYLQQGLYCSGYHFERGDFTYYIVFRDKNTNQEKETINVADYETAEKIYKEYGYKK